MKHFTIIRNYSLLLLLSAFAFAACSDSSGPSDESTVNVVSEVSGSTVARTMKSGDISASAGGTVDSLRVKKVRVLVSRLKMKLADKDTVSGDKEIKDGPFVLQADSGQSVATASAVLPNGSYDELKFEFHRLSSAEVSLYLSNVVFADFVTTSRYTCIIEGTSYKGGVGTPFVYNSDATANISYKFNPAVTISGTTTFAIQIDPTAVFIKGGSVLDPADSSNKSDIDNAIKASIKANKK